MCERRGSFEVEHTYNVQPIRELWYGDTTGCPQVDVEDVLVAFPVPSHSALDFQGLHQKCQGYPLRWTTAVQWAT